MAINKTLEINWDGVQYDVHVTMRLIDRIEEDLNLMLMVKQCTTGDVRFSHAALLVGILLRSAGAQNASQEQVFEAMFSGEGDIDPSNVVNLMWDIFSVIFPQPKKKSIAQTKKQKKSLKGTRGKQATKL